MYHRDLHKVKPISFANIEHKRLQESSRIKYVRRSKRTEVFNLHRNISSDWIPEGSGNTSLNEVYKQQKTQDCKQERFIKQEKNQNQNNDKMLDRKLALKKFRMERDAMKKELKKKQRPPFKVGIVHHGSSPILKDLTNIRVTRAMTKENSGKSVKTVSLMNKFQKNSPVQFFPLQGQKTSFKFKAPFAKNVKRLTSPHTPEVLKRSVKKNLVLKRSNCKSKDVEHSHLSTHSGKIIALSITKIKTEETFQNDDESIAGKEDICTEEEQIKRAMPSDLKQKSSDAESNMDHNQESLRHRVQLEEHTCKLLALADKWNTEVALHHDVPKEVIDEIDSVVGQTRLLTRDKFNQFRGLIEQLEQQAEPSKLITSNDLDGFWEMIYLQVESLLKRFADLQSLKNNNWIQTEPEFKNKKGGKRKLKRNKTPNSLSVINDISVTPQAQKVQVINKPSTSKKKFMLTTSELTLVDTDPIVTHRKTRASRSLNPV